VLEALTFCSEILSCERFVPILNGLSHGDVQMKVCLVTVDAMHSVAMHGTSLRLLIRGYSVCVVNDLWVFSLRAST